MRHESLYLNDIVEAADAIARFIAGIDDEAFQSSDLVRSAVVHKLSVIGEAAARLSDDIKGQNPQIPWGRWWVSATFSSMHISGSNGTSYG